MKPIRNLAYFIFLYTPLIMAYSAEMKGFPPDSSVTYKTAGGHVAAVAGTVDGFEEADEDLTVSSRPEALVLFNPVFDNGPDGYGHDRVGDYWEAFSPMHNIGDETPPTVVFLGTEDNLVPVETAIEYKQRMEAVGRRCDLHVYEGQGHGFFNYRNQEIYLETVLEMDCFLASLGYLQGEPGLPVPDLPIDEP